MSEGSSVGKVSGPPRHWDYLLTTMMTQIGVKFSCHSVLLTNDRRDIFPPPCCLHRTNSKILKTSMDTEHGEWKIDPRCFHLSIETLDKTSGERKALYERWPHANTKETPRELKSIRRWMLPTSQNHRRRLPKIENEDEENIKKRDPKQEKSRT